MAFFYFFEEIYVLQTSLCGSKTVGIKIEYFIRTVTHRYIVSGGKKKSAIRPNVRYSREHIKKRITYKKNVQQSASKTSVRSYFTFSPIN